MVIIPSGFLVPTKGEGALTIFDLSAGGGDSDRPYQVTSASDGTWFYHRAVWLDMNGDGRTDIVTCRANKPLFGKSKTKQNINKSTRVGINEFHHFIYFCVWALLFSNLYHLYILSWRHKNCPESLHFRFICYTRIYCSSSFSFIYHLR